MQQTDTRQVQYRVVYNTGAVYSRAKQNNATINETIIKKEKEKKKKKKKHGRRRRHQHRLVCI